VKRTHVLDPARQRDRVQRESCRGLVTTSTKHVDVVVALSPVVSEQRPADSLGKCLVIHGVPPDQIKVVFAGKHHVPTARYICEVGSARCQVLVQALRAGSRL
jgi:hypothetical protein